MATIKAIEDRTVHQIQSGQVIVDLCSVVKELVENSLDAGATSIEVRFKNQGLDSIEVQDNGDGITPENYETVALKHHTSKLATYDDLASLMTFGFRGEALSSLCALSKFTITTCMAANAPKGTKLEFGQSGALKGTSVVAAPKGTTVTVENLFHNLPVRRQELQRKIKTEWNRVTNLLGQYACIQTGVKISVSQQAVKGKKVVLFSTKGNTTTRENIVNVFGAKTLTALLPLNLDLELEPTSGPSQRWSTQEDGESKKVKILGHISRPAFGEGRQTPDRQMFFVNARPCGLPQVTKAFNEVYKMYNSHQSAFIFANIILDTHMYDVNVSPDKRTIMLHDQTRMLEELKTKLTELFEIQDYTVPISQLPVHKQPSYKQLTISRQSSTRSGTETPQEETPEPKRIPSEDESEHSQNGKARTASHEDDVEDEESSKKKYNPEFRRGTVSRETLNRDREAVNLVSNWLDKRTKQRAEVENEATEVASKNEKAQPISKEKWKLIEKLSKEATNRLSEPESTQTTSTTQSTESTDIDDSTPTPSFQVPVPVRDFNDRLAELEKKKIVRSDMNKANLEEDSIPSLSSPAKRMLPASTPFSTQPKPRQSRATKATITIGDHTITTTIGSPSQKRQGVDRTPANPSSAADLPSFGSRLSQRFAADGQVSASISDDEDEELIVPQHRVLHDVDVEADVEDQEVSSDHEDHARSHDGSEELSDGSGGLFVEETPEVLADISDKDDGDYVDEEEKKAQEDAKVQEMIRAAEETTQKDSDHVKRTNALVKGGARRKDTTVQLEQTLSSSIETISKQLQLLSKSLSRYDTAKSTSEEDDSGIDSEAAEEKLSLTINKSDFAKMKIVGQFNLGFILATRPAMPGTDFADPTSSEELFIIDQHASDEKYNFERLQNTTTVQSQRLVQPKTLDLTALEEEIVMENLPALTTNGFIVTVDNSGYQPVGQRCQLVSLPLSRETTFSLQDLEELIALLAENPAGLSGQVPRPSKVRKMFAMRACRSSIMIGKTLDRKRMEGVVRHMGEIDKPWNCPHGRPTMRHLCGLGRWDEVGWREGDGVGAYEDEDEDLGRVGPNKGVNWAEYLRSV